MKTVSFLVAMMAMGWMSFSQADAGADLCDDSIEAVCGTKPNSANKQGLAKSVSNLAAAQTQFYLKTKNIVSADQFLNQIVMNLQKPQRGGFSKALRASVLYISCLDYLSRAYFSSESDINYLGTQCFPDQEQSIASALARLADVQQHRKTVTIFKEVRELVTRVVSESKYSDEIKPFLINLVQNTEYISVNRFANEVLDSFSEAVRKDPKVVALASSVVLHVLTQCDPTAQQENAFNYAATVEIPLAGKLIRPRMVICPSMWLSATRQSYRRIEQKRDPDAMARIDNTYVKPPTVVLPEMDGNPDNLVVVISHELGHSVDTWIRDQVLSIDAKKSLSTTQDGSRRTINAFTSCLDRRHVKTGDLVAKLFGKEVGSKESAEAFFNEYHADSIAANTVGLYVWQKFSQASVRQEVIKNNLKMFCRGSEHESMSTSTTGLHPAGYFRIKNAFLGNLNLRRTLGCSKSPKVVGCSFR